jgi:CheY-like chemotaxis protein
VDKRPWILVVDDNHAFLEQARRFLTNPDWDLTTVATGAEACTICERSSPDLILIDYHLDLDTVKGAPATALYFLPSLQRNSPKAVIIVISATAQDFPPGLPAAMNFMFRDMDFWKTLLDRVRGTFEETR